MLDSLAKGLGRKPTWKAERTDEGWDILKGKVSKFYVPAEAIESLAEWIALGESNSKYLDFNMVGKINETSTEVTLYDPKMRQLILLTEDLTWFLSLLGIEVESDEPEPEPEPRKGDKLAEMEREVNEALAAAEGHASAAFYIEVTCPMCGTRVTASRRGSHE